MNRLRGIHLFFILLTGAVIFCFWFGFSYGRHVQRQEDLVTLSDRQQEERALQEIAQMDMEDANMTQSIEERANGDKGQADSDQVSSAYKTPQFYMKENVGTVSVYISATDELYFETDIAISDLPIELQEEMAYGIDFYDLDSVYGFLENYSS